jgi:hypothetical protein
VSPLCAVHLVALCGPWSINLLHNAIGSFHRTSNRGNRRRHSASIRAELTKFSRREDCCCDQQNAFAHCIRSGSCSFAGRRHTRPAWPTEVECFLSADSRPHFFLLTFAKIVIDSAGLHFVELKNLSSSGTPRNPSWLHTKL